MIRNILNWFFDLGPIPADATGLDLAWARPMSGWVWFLAFIAAITLAAWSYSKLQGSPAIRFILATLRACTILLVIVIIAGPQVRFPREVVEQDVVIALVDRSSSMSIRDMVDGSTRITRDEQLARILQDNESTWRALDERSELRWIGFSAGSFALKREEPFDSTIKEGRKSMPRLGAPDGWRTDISASLRQAIDGASARPISGIVLFSDGRSSTRPGRSMTRLLQQNAIPVFVVPLGSSDPVRDIAVGEIIAPHRAFIRDSVPVLVEIKTTGSGDGAPVVALLVDAETGKVHDRRTIELDGDKSEVLLNANLDDPGVHKLVVEIQSITDDLLSENDRKEFEVEIVDRPIRVLYIEGYPRWEYRYLKNLLVREETIESSVMLISADRDFAQEGNTPIARLPRTKEEFEVFDLIIIGDVPSGFFSPEQLRLIAEQVAERGTGLFWIGGSRNTPSSWAGTPLDDLLPIRSPLDLEQVSEGVLVKPTPLAMRIGVLMLDPAAPDGWASELSESTTGWSKLHSVQRVDPTQIKPTTEILAFAEDSTGSTMPILLSMRFGAGQVLFSAMDDIWRWRFGRGETLTERWWIGLVRMLARHSLDSAGRSMVLTVEPSRLVPGSAARIVLVVVDERTAGGLQEVIGVEVRDKEGTVSSQLELVRSGELAEWATDWFPDQVGQFKFHINDPMLAAMARVAGLPEVEVVRPDDEFRILETDHRVLRELAEVSGGAVLGPESLNSLPTALPNREVLVQNPLNVPIWNTGTFFLLLLVLLSAEWIGRRMIRMV